MIVEDEPDQGLWSILESPPPPAPVASGPWTFRGHHVVQATVFGDDQPDLIYCSKCGANAQRQLKAGKGLLAQCLGPEAASYRNARNRLKRRLFPHQSVDLRVSDGRVPDTACRESWAPLLGLDGPGAGASQVAPGPGRPVYGLPRVHMDLPGILRAYGFETFEEAAGYGKAIIIRARIQARSSGDSSGELQLEDELGMSESD